MPENTGWYTWPAPIPTDQADIRDVNSVMDSVDSEMKTIETANSSKIHKIGQYSLKRKITLNGGGAVTLLSDSTDVNPLWQTDWETDYSNTGNFVFNPDGDLFFEEGIYRINYVFTIYTYTNTLSGYTSLALYDSASTQIRRTKTYVRSNTYDSMPRTTLTGSMYVWAASSGSDQCSTFQNYLFGVQQNTTAGTINLSFNPVEIEPFRSQITIESVRGL